MMQILCLGISHKTAPIEFRERLAFDDASIAGFLDTIFYNAHYEEMAILSTCNRVEIYTAAADTKFDELTSQLTAYFKLNEGEIDAHAYQLVNEQVISHLFRVTAGLDSMVLGEPQILGQVTGAYELAVELRTVGPRLSKLFLSAIRTGKRVRTETAIGKKSVSIPSLAARLASKHVLALSQANIMLLGAGEMAELAVEAFRKLGGQRFTVVSRTLASACNLAERWQGEAATMDMLEPVLADADILVSSSSTPHTLIEPELIRRIMVNRPVRPLVILDIAVPRDVNPHVADITGVTLYDIDGLQEGVEESLAARKREVPQAEKILVEEYGLFLDYLAGLKVVPVIKQIRNQAETIRDGEVQRMLQKLPDLSPEAREQIHLMSRSLIKKILHTPTIRLRQEANGPQSERYEQYARELFGLNRKEEVRD